MPLPNYVLPTDIFFTWLDATNNLTSHVSNTSAYILVAQNATPQVSVGNVAINGVVSVNTISSLSTYESLTVNAYYMTLRTQYPVVSTSVMLLQNDGSGGSADLAITANFDEEHPYNGPFVIQSIHNDMVLRVSDSGGNLILGDWNNWTGPFDSYGTYDGVGSGDGGGDVILRGPIRVRGPIVLEGHNNDGTGASAGTLNNETGGSVLYNAQLSNTVLEGQSTFGPPDALIKTTINATHVITSNLEGNGSLITGLNANNLTSGVVLSTLLPVANATANGIVTTGTQTFAGTKTFQNAMTLSDTLRVMGSIQANTLQDTQVTIRANGALSTDYLLLEANGGNVIVNAPSSFFRTRAGDIVLEAEFGNVGIFANDNDSVNIQGTYSVTLGTGNSSVDQTALEINDEAIALSRATEIQTTLGIRGNVTASGDRLVVLPDHNTTGDWRFQSLNALPVITEVWDSTYSVIVEDTATPTSHTTTFSATGTEIPTLTGSDATFGTSVAVGNTKANIEATEPGVVLDATGLALYQANVVLGRGDTYVLFPNFATDGSKLWFQDGVIQFANTTLVTSGEAGGLFTPVVVAQDLNAVPAFQTRMETTGLLIETIADEEGNQDYRVIANNSTLQMESVNGSKVTTLTADGLTTTDVFATNLSGNGSAITSLDASVLTTGTVPLSRLSANVLLTTSTTGINASALSTGTVPLARLTDANTTANGVVTTIAQTFAGVKTFQNAVSMQSTATVNGTLTLTTTAGLSANGSLGTAGQLLYSNGSTVYWATPTYASPDDVIALAIALG